nr:rRNA adenine N(6)-methyltransferase family protein [Nocardioides speluncae]
MVDASPVAPGDLVLDLGAGTGALTEPLLDAGARVIAVELHPRRAAQLRERYADRPVTVVRTDLAGLRLPRRPFRVVASPPYQLSTSVLRLLLGTDRLLSADLVLQRTAARRLAGSPPRARHARRYQLEVGMPVPRSAFAPPPQVDSAVLRVRATRP